MLTICVFALSIVCAEYCSDHSIYRSVTRSEYSIYRSVTRSEYSIYRSVTWSEYSIYRSVTCSGPSTDKKKDTAAWVSKSADTITIVDDDDDEMDTESDMSPVKSVNKNKGDSQDSDSLPDLDTDDKKQKAGKILAQYMYNRNNTETMRSIQVVRSIQTICLFCVIHISDLGGCQRIGVHSLG